MLYIILHKLLHYSSYYFPINFIFVPTSFGLLNFYISLKEADGWSFCSHGRRKLLLNSQHKLFQCVLYNLLIKIIVIIFQLFYVKWQFFSNFKVQFFIIFKYFIYFSVQSLTVLCKILEQNFNFQIERVYRIVIIFQICRVE